MLLKVILNRFSLFLFLAMFFTFQSLTALDSYEVKFEGSITCETSNLLENTSQLLALSHSPPATSIGLRRRAEADVQNLLRVLHSQGYYNAVINLDFDYDKTPPLVIVTIITGPIYPLAELRIVAANPDSPFPYDCISPQDLNIRIGEPAIPDKILGAEENFIEIMDQWGYPFASVKKREVIADQAAQSLTVVLHVDSGPQAFFGSTSIVNTRHSTVLNEFFQRKVFWRKGEVYNPNAIERTQAVLEASRLFSSITISHAEELSEDGTLPMEIDVIEGKHRSVGWGVAYTTQRGPGLITEWEHRNVRGLGERIAAKASLWGDMTDATVAYIKPDFLCAGQDLIWLAEVQHESTKGYTETSFTASTILERQLDLRTRFSYGILYKRLRDTRSGNNGQYNLIKTPFQFRWSNANNLLDPTSGESINLKIIPSLQFIRPQFAYCISTLTNTFYWPLTCNQSYVLAGKFTIGSIFGASKRSIPSSEKFYEGSDSNLRGYHYQTVSPLNDDDKPIGGRSMLLSSWELRMRLNETFGLVTFYDVGNVYGPSIPQLNHKVLQAIGVGLRYHTPVGPLRCDVAVPLNPRPHLDHRFQVYISIGQAF